MTPSAEWEALIAAAPGKDRTLTVAEEKKMANAVVVKGGGYAAVRAAVAQKRQRGERGPQVAPTKQLVSVRYSPEVQQYLWRCPIMETLIPEATKEMLQDFADAWNRHDVDALMSFMTEDCVFESSAGADACGTRYVGREAVRAGFAEVWAIFPDAHWGNARHFVHGDRGVSEWTFTGTRADGTRVEVHGCDLFTLRDGKIFLKNSYRKNRPPVAN